MDNKKKDTEFKFKCKRFLIGWIILMVALTAFGFFTEHASQEEVEKQVENKINISFDEYKLPQENIDINQNIVSKFIPFNGTGTSENL